MSLYSLRLVSLWFHTFLDHLKRLCLIARQHFFLLQSIAAMSIATVQASLWNTTDHTFHIKVVDEIALRVSSNRIASSNLWLGVLFTLVVTSILLSTSQQRKGPTFITQCIAFVLGILYNTLVQVRAFWRHDSTFRMPNTLYSPKREDICGCYFSVSFFKVLLSMVPFSWSLASTQNLFYSANNCSGVGALDSSSCKYCRHFQIDGLLSFSTLQSKTKVDST